MLSVTVGADEIDDVLIATVTWRYKQSFETQAGKENADDQIVWAEIGTKELVFEMTSDAIVAPQFGRTFNEIEHAEVRAELDARASAESTS